MREANECDLIVTPLCDSAGPPIRFSDGHARLSRIISEIAGRIITGRASNILVTIDVWSIAIVTRSGMLFSIGVLKQQSMGCGGKIGLSNFFYAQILAFGNCLCGYRQFDLCSCVTVRIKLYTPAQCLHILFHNIQPHTYASLSHINFIG